MLLLHAAGRRLASQNNNIKRCLSSSLYMWGTNTNGSLWKSLDPRESNAKRDVPKPIQTPFNDTVKKVVCGPAGTAVITEKQECFVTGPNKSGELGVGHTNSVEDPALIRLPVEDPDTTGVADVSLGPTFSAFVDTVGDLYTCGYNGNALSGGMGMLGHGDTEARYTPTLVTSLVQDGCAVKQVATGESHLTVLTTEGEVLCTGSGSYGRLGNYETVDTLYLEPVEMLSKVEQIAGGKSFTLALVDGIVYGWGRNHKGQLGTGLGLAVDMYAMQALPEPIETDELANKRIIKIAAGHSHAACITENNELYYWGMTLHLEPVRVDGLMGKKIVDVVCGQDFTLAIDANGHMYSFGRGKTGVLGQGSVKLQNQATLMEAFADENHKIRQASAGWLHCGAIV